LTTFVAIHWILSKLSKDENGKATSNDCGYLDYTHCSNENLEVILMKHKIVRSKLSLVKTSGRHRQLC